MNKSGFEQACREQNECRTQAVVSDRASRADCALVDMFVFGTTYCTTHRVMGECPYGRKVQS